MWWEISQIRVSLDFDEKKLGDFLVTKLNLPAGGIKNLKIKRKSLDARHKDLTLVYSLVFEAEIATTQLEVLLKAGFNLAIYQPVKPEKTVKRASREPGLKRPVIVGAGPAGLFAGLKLALEGCPPVIIERGDGLAGRIEKVNRFWKEGELDPESNIQYGIGGAGTFSDGKLTTRIKDPHIEDILETMVSLGAPPEILYWQYPHIGTDLLRTVVDHLQELIVKYGGEVRFRNRLTGLELVDSKITALETNKNERLETNCLILATGNSARDIYDLLYRKGFKLESKPFAVGIRIEHPQEIINKAQYGQWFNHPKLGPAEYHLTYNDTESGRGVYTFCMCPGGIVVGATSGPELVVTNGMSYHARASGIANAAIVVTVNRNDFSGDSPLAGVWLQEKLERRAYQAGGSNFFAPVQKLGDFLKKEPSAGFNHLKPSYQPGTAPCNLWEVLPENICQAVANGIIYFGRRIKSFDWPEAVLTGVETRTSAPVRILRNDRREAEGMRGVYPVGEGSGYAGGIVSSALDGWKTAEAIIENFGF